MKGFRKTVFGQKKAGNSGGILFYYALEDFNGVVEDSTSNNNDGTVVGETEINRDQPGKILNSYEFFGGSISTPITPPTGHAARSFSFWFKTKEGGLVQHILEYGSNADSQRFTLKIDFNTYFRFEIQGIGWTGDKSVVDDQWHHVVFTHDGSETVAGSKIYLDGELHLDLSAETAILNTGNTIPLVIGRDGVYNGNRDFYGFLDEIGGWNYALSYAEIQALWNNGNGKNPYLDVPGTIGKVTNVAVTGTEISEIYFSAAAPSSTNTLSFYKIYLDGQLNNFATLNDLKAINLTANQTYIVEISAVDIYGNEGAKSDPINAVTTKGLSPYLALYNLNKQDFDQDIVIDETGNYNATKNTECLFEEVGKVENAYNMDAPGALITTPLLPPTGSAARSFSFWLRTRGNADYSNGQHILEYGENATYKRFTIKRVSIWIRFEITGFGKTGTTDLLQYDVYGEQKYVHIVFTHDGSPDVNGCKMYVNGALEFEVSGETALMSTGSTNFLKIGKTTVLTGLGDREMGGDLDQLGIWDVALNQKEIDYIYNKGIGRKI